MKKSIILIILTAFTAVSCSGAKTSGVTEKPGAENSDALQETTAEHTAKRSGEDIVLTMAIRGLNPYIVNGRDMVEEFNDADNGYRIVLKDYAEDISFDERLSKDELASDDLRLAVDIMKGDMIDIIPDIFYDRGKYYSLAEKGAFTDLNAFLDTDEELGHEMLFDNVVEACNINDKLYYMPLAFTIDTLAGPEKYVGAKENWTFEEMQEQWSKMPEGSTISGHAIKDYVYFTLLRGCIGSFIDYDTAKCNYDSEEFINMLSFINSFDSFNGYKEDGAWDSPMFVYENTICGFRNYHYGILQALYGQDESLTYVGYPSSDGCGSFINVNEFQIAISSRSSEEKQEGAWEFLKTLLSYDYQYDAFAEAGKYGEEKAFPINMKAFEKKGEDQYMHEGESKNTDRVEGDMDEGYLTKAEYDRLVTFIKGIRKVNADLDDDIFVVLNDEIFAMFSGEKTPEQVAESVQNRVQILVSEKF